MSTRRGGCTQHARRGGCAASPFVRPSAGWMLAGALLFGAAASRAAEPTGDQLFAAHCASCHGADGEGGGPAASTIKITPPNLRTLAKRNGGQFPRDAVESYIDGRKQVESHGDRLMPVWGDFLQMPNDKGSQEPVRQRIAALADFIERLQYR
jgi:mono/diheme cytochrome c family protein